MTGASDGLPSLAEVIGTHGLSARKSLGQNFLLDLNITRKIARRAGDLSRCDVLEIGPGPGGLTRGLLMEGARRVTAVERDSRCIPALEEIAAAYPGRLQIVADDAMTFDPRRLLTDPVRVVANLPYNIGTELLIRWLSPPAWPPYWSSLTLMFQKEVAERITATPGSKSWGRLAILCQWRSAPKIVMELPARAFTPPPKVNSAVVHFETLHTPRFPASATVLSRVTAAAFGQRRKMLRSSLKSLTPAAEDLLVAAGIAPTERAEQISLEGFCTLSRLLESGQYGGELSTPDRES